MYPCSLTQNLHVNDSTNILTLRPKTEDIFHSLESWVIVSSFYQCHMNKKLKWEYECTTQQCLFAFHCHNKSYFINPEDVTATYSSNTHMCVLIRLMRKSQCILKISYIVAVSHGHAQTRWIPKCSKGRTTALEFMKLQGQHSFLQPNER
jgi:hypothetical protein